MIPIFSILALPSSIVDFIFFLKLYFSYRRSKSETTGIFSKVFLFLGLFCFFLVPPKLITDDLILIQISLDLSLFFGYLTMAYFLFIPFKIYYQREPPKPLFFSIIGLGTVFLIFSILNLKPAFIHFQNNFVFWSENQSQLLNIISGTSFSLIAIVGALFFYKGGLKSKEKAVRLRAFLISASIITIALAIGVRLVFGFLFNIFISTLIALFLGIFASLLWLIAVLLVKPEKKQMFYKKIYEEEEP